tara:strand:+ start:3279 stop:5612 length:2334 start_codon:yes stop_codon:yes gene_type:complete
MATAYTTSLKLALPTQGELTGTWGDTVNQQVTSMIEEAVAGLKTINTWSTNSATLSTADGTTSESRAAILNLTDTTSDLSGAGTVICPAASKVYIVKNATGQTITVKTASGSGIAIPDGTTGFVYCDGTNVLEALTNVAGNLVVGGNASIGGNLTVTGTTTFNGGTLTLGDANTDNIVFGGEVDSNIIPDDDDTHDLGSSSKKWKDIYIDGIAYLDAINLNGTAITSTAAELNILDGVTSTTAELNILDGVTATAAELNALDGITSTVAELNILDGVTASAADINLIDGVTNGTVSASKAVIVDSNKDISGFRNLSITGDLTVAGDDITMGTNTAGNLLVADGANFNSIAVGDLSEISSVANDDVFLAVDTSGGGLKKVTRSTIVSGLAVGGVAISNVVEDTTPQLGGNLDMNGQDIVTTSNANLELAPNGTGKVVVKGNTNQGAIQLNCEANSHGQIIIAAPHSESASNTLTLPSTGGNARLVSTSSTATLTNKTLTDPVITNITGSTITLDSAGDITLDADGADILLKDDGTTYGGLSNNSGELLIKSGTTTAMTFSGANVTLEGNLTVSGTTTTVNSTTVNLNDHNIVLDSGNSTSAVVNGAGITIEGGSGDDATFSYNTTGPKFELKLGSNHEDLQVDQLIAASLDISGNVDVDGTLETDALSINGTTITSTAAELNILDGVTSTAAELNILDGVTSTTAELNILDGVTSTTAELNLLDGSAKSTSSITIADADGFIVIDGTTTKQIPASDIKTYAAGSSATKGFATAMAIAL